MPARIQRRRTKGWRMPAGAIYVGRPTRWGNPWRVFFVKPATITEDQLRLRYRFSGYWMVQDDRRNWYPSSQAVAHRFAVRQFRRWATSELGRQILQIDQLRGRDLVCWCRQGLPCHADVLLDLANRPTP